MTIHKPTLKVFYMDFNIPSRAYIPGASAEKKKGFTGGIANIYGVRME